jgi:hypothetical protein
MQPTPKPKTAKTAKSEHSGSLNNSWPDYEIDEETAAFWRRQLVVKLRILAQSLRPDCPGLDCASRTCLRIVSCEKWRRKALGYAKSGRLYDERADFLNGGLPLMIQDILVEEAHAEIASLAKPK